MKIDFLPDYVNAGLLSAEYVPPVKFQNFPTPKLVLRKWFEGAALFFSNQLSVISS